MNDHPGTTDDLGSVDDMADLARVRALVDQESAGDPGLAPTEAYLRRLCSAAARALDASGAVVSVMTSDGVRGLVIASSQSGQVVTELQVMLGEGPSLDAYELSRPVLEPHLVHSALRRWPNFCPAAVDAGVLAMFVFPLQVGAARLGVLDIHRAAPGSLSVEELGLALTIAEVCVLSLLDGRDDPARREPSHGLDQAMAYQSELYQAQGMVMVQLGVSLGDAMARLRAHAYAADRRLADVAHDVVARKLRLDRDHPRGPGEDLP